MWVTIFQGCVFAALFIFLSYCDVVEAEQTVEVMRQIAREEARRRD